MNKKLIITAFTALLMGFLTSCENFDINPFDDSEGESALTDMFFLATTSDSSHVGRDHKGKCNLQEVAVEDLPEVIKTYIGTNYPNATIVRAGKNEGNGKIVVAITEGEDLKKGLIFDADGNFLAEKVRGEKGEKINPDDLPESIGTYINTNYPNAELKKAFKGPEGNYGVLLLLEDKSYLGLGFKEDGTFIGELSMKDKKGNKHGPGDRKRGK